MTSSLASNWPQRVTVSTGKYIRQHPSWRLKSHPMSKMLLPILSPALLRFQSLTAGAMLDSIRLKYALKRGVSDITIRSADGILLFVHPSNNLQVITKAFTTPEFSVSSELCDKVIALPDMLCCFGNHILVHLSIQTPWLARTGYWNALGNLRRCWEIPGFSSYVLMWSAPDVFFESIFN